MAQAVYVDIDPDCILSFDLDTKILDLDDNGSTDFIFFNWSYYTFTSLGDSELRQALFANPNIHTNAIEGNAINYYSGLQIFPYALSNSDNVNNLANFQSSFFQKMAFRTYDSFGLANQGGNWFPEAIDKYLGVKFTDENDCYHYGWIRCDVKDEGRTLVIKDYAYETKCDVGILAGDKTGDTTTTISTGTFSESEIDIYTTGTMLYINLGLNQHFGILHIYDLSGKEIKNSVITPGMSNLEIKNGPGVYIIQIMTPNCFINKEIVIY